MTGSTRTWSLLTALAVIAALGCGDTSPTGATPTTTTLTLDFNAIDVIEDCDGIEGDGDFQFEVDVGTTNDTTTDVVYKKRVTLGPGGRTATIGRHKYEFTLDSGAPSDAPQVGVFFWATEYDKNILGQTYNDARLDNAGHGINHSYDTDLDQWVDVGAKSITLGESGCQVRLTWTATPA